MVSHRARHVELAIQPFNRRAVVVLRIYKGQNVTTTLNEGNIRAELATVARVGRGNLCSLRHQAEHEVFAEVIVNRAHRRYQIDGRGGGRMLEVGITRV